METRSDCLTENRLVMPMVSPRMGYQTGFLKDLRKQLLIWRLVTPEAKKRLTKEGEELLEQQATSVA